MTHTSLIRLARTFVVALVLAASLAIGGPSAFAGKDCAVFRATIVGPGGAVIRAFNGEARVTVPASQIPAGSTLQVRGTFVEFDVNLDTFTVRNYTLTGAPAPEQITDIRTTVFESKAPTASLRGPLSLRLKSEQLVLERGGTPAMKIQAKDCDQGGIFQMEPEPAATETNTLAPGFRYCYQASPDARRFFTNGVVLGFDSPQEAVLVEGTDTTAVWRVNAGGRIGGVFGEDALEALQLAGPAAVAACPCQCQ